MGGFGSTADRTTLTILSGFEITAWTIGGVSGERPVEIVAPLSQASPAIQWLAIAVIGIIGLICATLTLTSSAIVFAIASIIGIILGSIGRMLMIATVGRVWASNSAYEGDVGLALGAAVFVAIVVAVGLFIRLARPIALSGVRYLCRLEFSMTFPVVRLICATGFIVSSVLMFRMIDQELGSIFLGI
jgi:hypothetical protein